MAHMRDRTSFCMNCQRQATITANLDRGTVTWGNMPDVCKTPQKCLDWFKDGVFDRQFGEGLIKPRG